MNPGYTLIDCTGVDLTVSAQQTVTGIYEKVALAYAAGKPVYAGGMVYGDLGVITPVPVMVNSDGTTGYFATSSILQVHVETGDKVTVATLIG